MSSVTRLCLKWENCQNSWNYFYIFIFLYVCCSYKSYIEFKRVTSIHYTRTHIRFYRIDWKQQKHISHFIVFILIPRNFKKGKPICLTTKNINVFFDTIQTCFSNGLRYNSPDLKITMLYIKEKRKYLRVYMTFECCCSTHVMRVSFLETVFFFCERLGCNITHGNIIPLPFLFLAFLVGTLKICV